MSPERIRLFFKNFPLLSISQHNANSIAIFQYSATLFPSKQLSRHSIDFFEPSLAVTDAQPISCLDDSIKTTTFILAFYSSDDS